MQKDVLTGSENLGPGIKDAGSRVIRQVRGRREERYVATVITDCSATTVMVGFNPGRIYAQAARKSQLPVTDEDVAAEIAGMSADVPAVLLGARC